MARIVNKKTGRVLAEKNSDKQELHCHGCDRYVQFPIDLSMNGNHVLNCPNCGHEHCRVVENGRITSVRWDSRNGPTFPIASYADSITATTFSTGWGSATFATTSTASTGWVAY